jgi:hypothetical protein
MTTSQMTTKLVISDDKSDDNPDDTR